MVQSNEVKTGLHLVTASAWHMLPTLTEPCLWRTTETHPNINTILISLKNLESGAAMKETLQIWWHNSEVNLKLKISADVKHFIFMTCYVLYVLCLYFVLHSLNTFE